MRLRISLCTLDVVSLSQNKYNLLLRIYSRAKAAYAACHVHLSLVEFLAVAHVAGDLENVVSHELQYHLNLACNYKRTHSRIKIFSNANLI